MRLTMVGVLGIGLALLAGCEHATVRGPEGKKMTVESPAVVMLQRGQTEPVLVKIDRKKFTGPVEVSISQLPNGVTAGEASQSVQTDAATFMLKADKSADLVSNQAVKVTTKGPDGMQATQYIRLTVKP